MQGFRIENAFTVEMAPEEYLAGETFDVCTRCFKGLTPPIADAENFQDDRLTKRFDTVLFYNGNPAGNYWSGDAFEHVEHPPYEDEDITCHLCDIAIRRCPACG